MTSLLEQMVPTQGSGFPTQRLRRLRRSQAMRDLTKETTLSPSDFIYPMFVTQDSGKSVKSPPCRGSTRCPPTSPPRKRKR